jgi:predicted Ser/Thr protein kinase
MFQAVHANTVHSVCYPGTTSLQLLEPIFTLVFTIARVPQTLELLQASVDEGDEDSYLRLLVDGKKVIYITIAAGVFTPDDMCFGPAIITLLPPLPSGDWNYGYIAQDPQTAQPHFAQAIRKKLRGVENVWHPTTVDHLDLTFVETLRSPVCEVTCPQFPNTTAAYKFARFEWESGWLAGETAAYQAIEGLNIGPKFLGHVSEEGRVIGFLIEKVVDARHASIVDHVACVEALTKLHRLGFLHGDTNKHNFLVNSTGATLIDFESLCKSDNVEEFEAEIAGLTKQLNDPHAKGGIREHED